MTLPEPSYLPDAAAGFRLETGAGTVLAALPPTLRPTTPLGQPRALEWERAPYSEVWRPVGDNLPSEPPALTLQGTQHYATADEALTDMATIQRAVSAASRLTWGGRTFCLLRTDRRGLYLPSYGERATLVNHLLNLYPLGEITPLSLTGAPGTPTPTPPAEGSGYTLTLTLSGPALAPVSVTNLTTGQPVSGATIGSVWSLPGLTGGHTYRVTAGAVDGWTPPPDRTLTLTANTTISLTYTQAAPPPPPDSGVY